MKVVVAVVTVVALETERAGDNFKSLLLDVEVGNLDGEK